MKKLISIILLLSIAVLISCSSGPSSRRYPNYPTYPPNYPGSPYPGGGYGSGQIQQWARSLEEATSDLESETSKLETQLTSDDVNTIEALDNEAEDFSEEVSEPYMDPRRTSNDFEDLLRKYYEARKVVQNIPEQEEVQEEFQQVTNVMKNLSAFYGYRLNPDEEEEPIIR